MSKLNVVVAGCANPHIPGYLRGTASPDGFLNLLAVSDSSPEHLQTAKNILAQAPQVAYYDDYLEMLKRHPEADAVILGSDNIDHFKMFKEIVKFHKHIYMMKVISMDEDECLEMIEIGKSYGKVIQSELELHFNPQFAYARQLVQSGALGEIKSVYLTNVSQSPCNYFPNWGNPLLSYGKVIPIHPGSQTCRGGALTDHPHPFDLVRWITGREFAAVRGMSAPNQRLKLAVEDHVAAIGTLDNGIIFSINPSYTNLEEEVPERRLLWPKSLECNLKITGTKANFFCDYFDRHVYIVGNNYASPNRLIVDFCPRIPGNPDSSLLGSFIACIQNRRSRPETTLSDSLAAVKVMNKIYDSIYQNKELTF